MAKNDSRYKTASFWPFLNQNDVVLSFANFFLNLPITKRRRFGQIWSKTASFWVRKSCFKTTSFWVSESGPKRRRFGPVYTKTTSFCYVFKKKKLEQRRFGQPSFPKKTPLFVVLILQTGGKQGRFTGGRSFEWKSSDYFGASGDGR